MKATGIVRRIDDLGRVVIPKEIRRTLRIREGDPLEIFVDREGEVILKKYSPIGELGDFAKEYADALQQSIGQIALIADRDNIIAVSGAPKKEFMNKAIGPAVEKSFEERKVLVMNNISEDQHCKGCPVLSEDRTCKIRAQVVAPIISQGDPIGAVIIMSKEEGGKVADLEAKLAETAACFLAKQMEQ
jgi:AbrB family transcriptional regulator (stage V sporulation protein T)